MSRTAKNLLFFIVGFSLAVFAGIASADTLLCTTLDTDGVTCLSWVSATPFGLPALSIADANSIGQALSLLFVTAYCFNVSRGVV